jgi:RNA polymerase sigma-70 factor (ECF subfamily)
MVYNLCLGYLHSIEDAEEVTQDVFIKVYHSISEFKNKSSSKKRLKRMSDMISIFNSKNELIHFGKNFEHPGILLENKEKSILLFKAIELLPKHQKTVFILSKVEGLNNKEIAEILEKSISAVENLIHRAKDNLKISLSINFKEYQKKEIK